ncbi:MAG: 30S ribosomal protein S15 [Oligoflexia bacterium]|nr:30S ribosomal protein S15 [Oligoflexia bacterium]
MTTSTASNSLTPAEVFKEQRAAIIKKFGRKEKDTGSPEVQIALLTHRINSLSTHFDQHKKDYHSKRGLLQMVGDRKALLKYLAHQDEKRYKDLIKELGIRK